MSLNFSVSGDWTKHTQYSCLLWAPWSTSNNLYNSMLWSRDFWNLIEHFHQNCSYMWPVLRSPNYIWESTNCIISPFHRRKRMTNFNILQQSRWHMGVSHRKHFCGFFFFFSFKKDFLNLFFRQRGRETEREGEKYWCEKHWSVASHTTPSKDLACNPGMCPDWESNLRPLSLQAGAQTTELFQPGFWVMH